MSVLSKKLSYFVEQRKQSIVELAKRSGIERSTLYQYLKGKRPMQNRGHLDTIMSWLHLTPDERAEILEAYEIDQVGIRTYRRRRRVKEILNSLLTVEEIEGKPQPAPFRTGRDEKISRSLICGELEVNRAIHEVVRDAAANGHELKLLAQPDYSELLEALTLFRSREKGPKVIQVICMEADSGQDGCSNLDMIGWILRYGVGIYRYEPRYFYGKISEHYGSMNVFPYLVVTEHYAFQISTDRKKAILHSDPDFVLCFQEVFRQIYQQSQPLLISMDSFRGQQAQWALQFAETMDFSNTIEVCSGLCTIQFWDEELIRTYINKELPDYEKTAQEYIAYTSALYQAKRRGQITVLMNASFAEEFIKTGVFREYPGSFFSKPVSREDRKKLIDRILEAADEGWYHVRMIDAEDFPLSYRWEILMQRDLSLLFQYSFYNQFRVFQFLESDILDAVYDFLENLAAGPGTLDEETSVGFLRKWSRRYLEE